MSDLSWRTVILTKDSKISLRLNHLVIHSDETITIPLSEIGQLIIENPNIVMTGHILNALSDHKITTIICDNKHLPFTQINLIYGHHMRAKMIKSQLEWENERKDLLWQEIIKTKILNQKLVLEYFFPEKSFTKFDEYAEQVQLNDYTNREGYVAKVYFTHLFGKDFIRGNESPINWALNYGYSLLLALFTRVIITKGLLTEIGIHHRNQFNHYNLASDFMEVYRPLIDFIVKEVRVEQFDRTVKRSLVNVFNKKILIKGKKQYLSNSAEIYVDSLIDFMNTGDLAKLNFPKII